MKKIFAVIILGALSYSVQAQCGKCPHHTQSNCTKAQTEATTQKQENTPRSIDKKVQTSDKQAAAKAKEEPKSNNNTSSQKATATNNQDKKRNRQ